MSHTLKRKHLCIHCKSPSINASFICANPNCAQRVCINCVWVTIIHGKWNFYCKPSCAPYRVDVINSNNEKALEHKEKTA
jgi:hypothetical protein